MSTILRNDQATPQSRLSSYPIVSTDDADAAQSVVSRELTGSRIHKIRDRKKFRFEMNGVHFGDTLVAWNRYESDIELNSGLVDDTVGFILGDQTPIFKMNDDAIACTRSTAALVSQSRMSVRRPAGSSIFVLKTTYAALERRYREVTGRLPTGRIRFDRMLDISSGAGLLARQTLMHVVSQLETDQSVVKNDLLRVSIDDLLLGTLLSLPHSYAGRMLDDSGEIATSILRRAEEFIEAHAAEPIKIRDVIEACGCSGSLLHRAFQRHRGYTPNQFLASQRLEAARRRLLSPSQHDTVTSVALDCGFAHLSRFAERYKRRFGEYPSNTLRNAR